MGVIVRTYSGRDVDLKNFTKDDIDLRDIAISLSRQRRYAGHTAKPWTVGQHLFLCGMIAQVLGLSDKVIMGAVLHDVEETWIQDTIWPIKKNYMYQDYDIDADKISEVVFEFFGCDINENQMDLVKCIDRAAYIIEAFHLSPGFVFEREYFADNVVEMIDRLVNDLDFKIPQDLMDLDEMTVAQDLFETLNVWAAEKVLGAEISVEFEDVE